MICLTTHHATSSEDALWIEETLEGDSAAFGRLVSKYQDRLFRSMLLVTGSRDESLDVVQDAFVQAMVKLDTFQGRSEFYTWLYRIAYNLVLASRRVKKKQRKILETLQWIARTGRFAVCRPDDRPERRMEREECRRQVRRALGRLNKVYAAVVVLREIDGLAYEEIAQILDLPPGTVRSRLHRARLQLVRLLKVSQREAEVVF